jgi:hypothetical protein
MRASHPGFDKAAELLGGVKVVRLSSNGPVGSLRCAVQFGGGVQCASDADAPANLRSTGLTHNLGQL